MSTSNSELKTTKDKLSASNWTFLTNHSHVLICLARDPLQSLREVANKVGITERAVQKIVVDLEDSGFLTKRREGRSNRYKLALNRKLRHPVEKNCTVSKLVDLIK